MTDEPKVPARVSDDAVVAAYIHGDNVAASWHHSLVEVLADDLAGPQRLYRGGWIAMHCGTGGLVEARNSVARMFLDERKADWLWITDTDMGFKSDVLSRLMEAADPVKRPIVGGLCFSQRELESDGMGGYRTVAAPTVYDWITTFDKKSGFAVRWDYKPNTLTRCSGTGMACILIHRSVFQKIETNHGPVWYDRVPNTSSGQLLSEDLSFCLRAGALNIPIHIDTGTIVSHLKPVWLSETEYVTQRVAEAARVKANGKSGDPSKRAEAAKAAANA